MEASTTRSCSGSAPAASGKVRCTASQIAPEPEITNPTPVFRRQWAARKVVPSIAGSSAAVAEKSTAACPESPVSAKPSASAPPRNLHKYGTLCARSPSPPGLWKRTPTSRTWCTCIRGTVTPSSTSAVRVRAPTLTGRASRLANVPCGIASGFICEKNIPHAPHWYRRRSMLMLLFPTVAGERCPCTHPIRRHTSFIVCRLRGCGACAISAALTPAMLQSLSITASRPSADGLNPTARACRFRAATGSAFTCTRMSGGRLRPRRPPSSRVTRILKRPCDDSPIRSSSALTATMPASAGGTRVHMMRSARISVLASLALILNGEDYRWCSEKSDTRSTRISSGREILKRFATQ
eukprot:7384462-Prymnesium_polylepis.1